MENTKIEWADHTFNPWWGCQKVSPACDNCYAEAIDRRLHQGAHWGRIGKSRLPASEHTWEQPLKWNRKAMEAGARARVFCASMGDIFEARSELDRLRARLWDLIRATRHLDWLLLTKRPHNFWMLPWCDEHRDHWDFPWPNVWLGVTAEDQQRLEERGRILVETSAAKKFISAEPLLGPLKLERFGPHHGPMSRHDGIDWVIAGGESGPKARPSNPKWFRSLRDQCEAYGIAFFFKQWGEWGPTPRSALCDIWEWPDSPLLLNHFDPKELPHAPAGRTRAFRVGKTAAGRALDGRTWDEVPR